MQVKWPKWLLLSRKRRRTVIPMLFGLLVTLGYYQANIYKPPQIEQLANLLFDAYQKKKPREYNPDTPVRIIDIDNESLERLGQWPWPRSLMAKLNDRLSQAGAGVIAYDIIFSEPDRTSPENIVQVLRDNPAAKGKFEDVTDLKGHDQMFANSFSRTQVVAGFFLVREPTDRLPKLPNKFSWGGSIPKYQIDAYNGAILPLPVLQEQVSGEGFVSFNPKGDGIIREAPLISRIGNTYYRSLALEAMRVAFQQGAIVVRVSDGTGEMMAANTENPEIAKFQIGPAIVPTTPDGKFIVYYTERQKERYIPAWKILSDDIPMSEWAERVAGHIVFVGTGADGLKDLVATPLYPREPGVLVHAQIVEQVLNETFLSRSYKMSRYENYLLVLTGLLLALVLPRLGAFKGIILSAVIVGGVLFWSWQAFVNEQALVNPIYILLSVLTSYILVTLSAFYLTESERSQIRSAFSMYLSPTMVKKVSEDPDLLTLGGEERMLTILFLDIRSFSKISEGLEPEEITTFLNIFLSPMTTILQENGATIDKYMGDAIVAFWNAPLDDPNHERNGARAVRKMIKKLDDLNVEYADQNEVKWPDNVKVGIGLNTGICCVGNLGSEQRFSYSMIGDAANLASRIEGLTKQYKVAVLIGNSTAEKLPELAIIEADLIQVIGRQTPERIHILAGEEEMAGTEAYKTLIPIHTKFLKAYRAQDWSKAESYIPELRTLAKDMQFDGYYVVMAARINEYKTDPPPKDWDGVYVAKSK